MTWRSTQETTDHNVLDDVASNICQDRRLWPGTNVTMEPPPSPVGPEELGGEEEEGAILRLVPIGATDVRISVFPWALSPAAAAAEAEAAAEVEAAGATAQPTLTLGSGGSGGGSSDVE
jgi:hypothetical protein